MTSWSAYFACVPDPRRQGGCLRHLLSDILGLALCAMLCGADDFEEMELFGRQREGFLKEHLGFVLSAGVPSHDTFTRVFGALNISTTSRTARWSAPQAALWVPEADRQMAGGQVLIGSFVTEGGSGLAALDLDGRKKWGTGWIGGAWPSAPFLARDVEAGRVEGTYAYVGSAWGDEAHPGHAEVRLTAMRREGDRALPRYSFVPAKAEVRFDDYGLQLGGGVARDGLLVAALPKMNQLLFMDAHLNAVRGTVSCPDVRGVALDDRGRLLALSGQQSKVLWIE